MKNFIITTIVLIVLISCGGSTTEAPEVTIEKPEVTIEKPEATIEVHATIDSGITARLAETPKLESTQTPQPKASDSTQPKNTIKINTSDEEKDNK